MTNKATQKIPHKITQKFHWTFWAIGIFALMWNLMGIMNFTFQMNPDQLAQMPQSHRLIAESRPEWANITFAISVLGGAYGAILLLLRKVIALPTFIIALIATIVTIAHAILAANALEIFTPFEIVIGLIAPILLMAFLVRYAWRKKRRGWLT